MYFMFFIGFLEFAGGIAILIPRINKYGALTLAVVMLGALVTRLVFGTSLSDVIYIATNMVILLFLSLEYGLDDLIRQKTSWGAKLVGE